MRILPIESELTRSKIFAWLCGAFIAGVAAASFFPDPVMFIWAFFVAAAGAAAYGVKDLQRGRRYMFAACLLLFFAFGMLRFVQKNTPSASLPPELFGAYVVVSGRIIEEPVDKQKSQQLIVESSAIEKNGERIQTREKILVTAKRYPQFTYGTSLNISGKITEPENFTEDFDYRAYLAKDDIRYVMVFPDIEAAGEPVHDLYSYLFALKGAFSRALNRALPEPHASFAAGLILGERRGMPQDLLDDFRRTGTTHIVALSGYNITIVGDAVMKVLAFLTVPFAAAFWVSVAAIMLFTLLTGASASIVRAAIMGVLVLVARKEGRMYSVKNALLLTAAAMIFQNPKILRFDTAFQLSFLATIGLIYLSPAIEERLESISERARMKMYGRSILEERAGRTKKFFLQDTLVSTIAAQMMVLPLLIHLFGSVSIISPLSNVLILTATPYAMFFSFATGALGIISEMLGRVAAPLAWLLLEYEMSLVRFFAGLPFASIGLSKSFGILLALLYGWVLLQYAWQKRNATDRNAAAGD